MRRMHWKSAATASASSMSGQTSQMRISRVGKRELGRRSHQILEPSSSRPELVMCSIMRWYSLQLTSGSGRPVRGMASNTVSRYDASPVSCPCQKGEEVVRQSIWGRKYRAWFIRSIRSSSSSMPTWTCMPQMSMR